VYAISIIVLLLALLNLAACIAFGYTRAAWLAALVVGLCVLAAWLLGLSSA
jgi:hypothetical protein